MPAKFDLKYVDSDGVKKTPVVLHRAILGSLDRFIAYILEETKGCLPTWLSPIQVNIIPVNVEKHQSYADKIYNLLNDLDIRVSLDVRDEKLGYKMRESQTKKIPFTLILGEEEIKNETISYRLHGKKDTITVSLDKFIKVITDTIKNKK